MEREGTGLRTREEWREEWDSKPPEDREMIEEMLEAAYVGQLEAVRRLAGRVGVNARNDLGQTALHRASYNGHQEVVRWLVEGGAEVNARNVRRTSPLMWAAYNNHLPVARLLVTHGADPLLEGRYGRTALSWAQDRGHKEMERLLTEARDKPDLVPRSKQIAIEDTSSLKFSKEEKKMLASCKIIPVLPMGETKAGKTTMIRTIIQNKLTELPKRTEVAEVHIWSPVAKQETIFMVYDIGGNRSYRKTAHYFQVDSPSALNLLCHDILSEDYESTFFWLQMTQINSPSSETFVVITQVDKIKRAEERKAKSMKFVTEFGKLIDQQIDMTKKERAASSNTEIYTKRINNYKAVLRQIKTNLLIISCVPNSTVGVKAVKDLLQWFAEKQKHQVTLRIVDRDLFVRIGTLGLKAPMAQNPVGKKTTTQSPKQRMDKQDVWEVSSTDTGESTTAESQGPSHLARGRQDTEPERMRQRHLEFDVVKDEFEQVLKKHNLTVKDLVAATKQSLKNLNNKGLLGYFMGDEQLEKIVFNDIAMMVNILKVIYHHDMEDFLQTEEVDEELKADVDDLHRRGIISQSLLKMMLLRSGCLIDAAIVMKLLPRLDVGTIFKHRMSQEALFVPYFLHGVVAPAIIEALFEKIGQYQGEFRGFHLRLRGNLPIEFFQLLLVKMYEHLPQWKCSVWSKGLLANMDQYKAELIMHHNDANEIEFAMKADLSQRGADQVLRDGANYVASQSKNLKQARFPGLPLTYKLTTTHTAPDGVEVETVQTWDADYLSVKQEYSFKDRTQFEDLPFVLTGSLSEGLLSPFMTDYIQMFEENRVSGQHDYASSDSESPVHGTVDGVITGQEGVPDNVQRPSADSIPVSRGADARHSTSPLGVHPISEIQSREEGIDRHTDEVIITEPESLEGPSAEHGLSPVGGPGDAGTLATTQHVHQLSLQVSRLQQQMSYYMQRLSDQMFIQGQSITRTVLLEPGDASALPLEHELTHPALKECLQALENKMDPNTDLLDSLVTSGVLDTGDKEVITQDHRPEGKVKRILLKTDRHGSEGVRQLAYALQESGHANKVLGDELDKVLDRCYAEPVRL